MPRAWLVTQSVGLKDRRSETDISTDAVRPPSIDIAKVRDLKKKRLERASEIAKALNIGRASVYRALLSAP
jgi:DNA invertase Pin-like site-specific DNA recombinase